MTTERQRLVGAATEAGNSALEWLPTVPQASDFGTAEPARKIATISTAQDHGSAGVLGTVIKKGAVCSFAFQVCAFYFPPAHR